MAGQESFYADLAARDHQLRQREQQRAEKEFALRPILQSAQGNYASAIDFAKEVIKGGFILNGGALVAIPALATFFEVDRAAVRHYLLYTTFAFAFGLLLMWLTAMFAFLAARFGEASKYSSYEQTRIKYDIAYGDLKDTPEVNQEMNGSKEAAQRRDAIGRWFTKVAVATSAVSLASFLAGIYFSLGAFGVFTVDSVRTPRPPISDVKKDAPSGKKAADTTAPSPTAK